MTTLTITVPNNWLDYCADASISDTLNDHAGGRLYRKGDEQQSLAWLEACIALNAAPRKRSGTTVTISIAAARAIADDLRWWGTLRSGRLNGSMITAAHARQCMNACTKIEQQLAGA